MDPEVIAMIQQVNNRRDYFKYPDGPFAPTRPLVPTVAVFDNVATLANLDKATDGNKDTSTDYGSKQITVTASEIGEYIFDLGASVTLDIGIRVGLKSTSGVMNIIVDQSDDGQTYTNGATTLISVTATGDNTKSTLVQRTYRRFIRLRATLSSITGTQTGNFQLFDISGSKL